MQGLHMLFAIAGTIAATGGHAGPSPRNPRVHLKGGPETIAKAKAKRQRRRAKRLRDRGCAQ